MKKLLQVFLIMVLSCSVLTLSGCDEGNTLYLLNWAEYIDEDLIALFEEENDCRVVLDIANSNEAMYSKIVSDAAPYDIAFPSDYMVGQMIADNDGIGRVIQPIDFSKLSNYSTDPTNPKSTAKFNPEEGSEDQGLIDIIKKNDCFDLLDYAIPYFWGSLGIMYNTESLTEDQIATIEEKGWAVLFEPDLLGAGVKIGMYASARDSIAAALLYNGYSLNSKNSNELMKAEESLYKMNYHAWATDDLKTGVATGKYDVALVYSGDYFDVLYSAYDVPEGVEPNITFDMFAPSNNNVFFDAMVIPTNSRNTELAYKFIDFMLDTEKTVIKEEDGEEYEIIGVAEANAQYVGYCPTVYSVFSNMVSNPDFEGVADLAVYNPGNIQNGEIYKYLGSSVYAEYDRIYKKVKK